MAQGPKNQIWEWTADSAKVITDLTEVGKRVRAVTKEVVAHNVAQASGKTVDEARGKQLLENLAKELNAREQLRKKLNEMKEGHEKLNESARLANVRILSLAYGVDDFLTVAQMGNDTLKSMTGGLAAAANNIGILLSTYSPWLIFVPAIVSGFARIGVSAYRAGQDVEDSGKKLKEAIDLGNQIIAQGDEVGMASESVAEKKRQQETEKAINARREKIRDLILQKQDISKERDFRVIPGAEPGEGQVVSTHKNKRMMNIQQQIDIEEKAARDMLDIDKRARDEFARRQQEAKAKQAAAGLGPARGLMVDAAGHMLGAGMDDAKIRGSLSGLLAGGGIAPELQGNILQQILFDARAQQIEESLRPKKSGARGRLESLDERRLELTAQREAEESKDRDGRLPSERRRYYDKQESLLKEDTATTKLQVLQEERAEKAMTDAERSADALEKIEALMEKMAADPVPGLGGSR